MKIIKYNKLIRDNIPKIIEESGKECTVSVLDDEEYVLKLKEKLVEEAKEVLLADNKEIINELADVLEVFETIEKTYRIKHESVLNVMKAKNEKNGGFNKKLLLLETREND